MMGFKKNWTAAFALFLSSAMNTVNATDSTGSIKAKPVLGAGNAKKLRDEHSITEWMGLAEPPNTPELPDDCSQLDAVNSSGICLYNDCSCTGGECFYAPPTGCGSEGFTIPTWVYDEAYCIHDYCYSSNRYSQRHCDNTFLMICSVVATRPSVGGGISCVYQDILRALVGLGTGGVF